MKHKKLSFFNTLLLLMIFSNSIAEPKKITGEAEKKQFTFSWQFIDSDTIRPRGGTTKGTTVEISQSASASWQKLSNNDLSKFDKDRQAILAMAGNYRVTFDFIETIVNEPDSKPDRPYQSWGTEYVFIVEDKSKFISLQHILVMTFLDENGNVSAPMVMKHWRQDWQYSPTEILVHNLRQGWNKHRTPQKPEGQWSQTVYQVDDSPRYAARGQWKHMKEFSIWSSEDTLRPLPRREFSVRSDYDLLWGTNRITILPTGWVHEEDNLKMVITNPTEAETKQSFKSREAGVARYEAINGLDISPAENYWETTQYFWRDVREEWNNIIKENEEFWIRAKVSDQSLFSVMFSYAAGLEEENGYDTESSRDFVRKTLNAYKILKMN